MSAKKRDVGESGGRPKLPAVWRWMFRAYRAGLSPLLGPSCRFYPSCSAYAEEALQTWGFPRGFFLAVWRLLRCHPFSRGGLDPVPPRVP